MSNNYLTARLNEHSIEFIRSQIQKKLNGPYFSTNSATTNVVTDMDHHPYSRWFRGVYYFPNPIIMEREAGWRPRRDSCYEIVEPPILEHQPDHCFEPPCTTTFPCYPEFSHYQDRQKLNQKTNKGCMVQYY
jgi:hypothetical protein